MITLFGSSAYPERLNRLVRSLDRSAPFEIVVCGPNRLFSGVNTIDDIPFRFIYSEFKPTQCSMIAARNASGRYLLHIVDDIHFIDPSGLSSLVQEHQKMSAELGRPVFSSTRLQRPGEAWDDTYYYLGEKKDIPVPVSIFCEKTLFFQFNGFDCSFICAMADADLIRRGRMSADAYFHLSSVIVEETKVVRSVSLFDIYGQRDIATLMKKYNGLEGSRFFVLEYLEKKPLGPSGVWRCGSPVIRWLCKKYFYVYLRLLAKWNSVFSF